MASVDAMEIRAALEADLAEIVRIYNLAIPGRMATADTEPVDVAARRDWFAAHTPHDHPLWVIVRDGRILGWASLGAFYGRPAYGKTREIGVYVDPAEQRAGIGSALVDHARDRSRAMGLRTLLAFVFSHNVPSLRLFQKAGFVVWGELPGIAELDGIERGLTLLGLRLD